MTNTRTAVIGQWALALVSAISLAACSDATSTVAPTTGTRYGAIPPVQCSPEQIASGNCNLNGTLPSDGVPGIEFLEVCKVWAGGAAPADIKVRVQVSGGVTKDTIFTIKPGDGKDAAGNPLQCRSLWVNGRADPADLIAVSEVVPSAGYTTTWAMATVVRGSSTVTNTSGSGADAPTTPIGGPTNGGAVVTFTNTPIIATGSISNYTWIDANGNGKQDSGEPVLDGVVVALGGAASATTTSAGGGLYLFSGLAAGSYTVTATAPTGFGFTTANAVGTNSGNDSNGSSSAVTLATNSSTDDSIDFGFVKLGGSGGQGCTPGYWKQSQHFDSWKWYTQTNMVDATFNVTFRSVGKNNPTGPLSLLQALELNGNNDGEQLFRHGTAALLNSVYQSGVNGPYSAAQVIQMVHDAWVSGNATLIASTKDKLSAANELGCPLN